MPVIGGHNGLTYLANNINGKSLSGDASGLTRLVEILAIQAAREAMRSNTRANFLPPANASACQNKETDNAF